MQKGSICFFLKYTQNHSKISTAQSHHLTTLIEFLLKNNSASKNTLVNKNKTFTFSPVWSPLTV